MLTIKAEGSAGVSLRDDMIPDMIRAARNTGCRIEVRANDTMFFCRPDDSVQDFKEAYDSYYIQGSAMIFPGMGGPIPRRP